MIPTDDHHPLLLTKCPNVKTKSQKKIMVIILPSSSTADVVVEEGATLVVEVDGSSNKLHPGCPVTQLGHVVAVRDGQEVNNRQ